MDDILLAAPAEHLRSFVKEMSKEYKLGIIVFGPCTLNFYGLTIIQDEDYCIRVHGGDKLHQVEPYPIDRNRRRQQKSLLNSVELNAFSSLNRSIVWLDIAASPFCPFAAN